MTDKMFTTVYPKDSKSIAGFEVLVRRKREDSWDGEYVNNTYFCPCGEVQLGANRILLGPKAIKRKSIDFTKCTCREPDSIWNFCTCKTEDFYYGAELERTLIANNDGVQIEEVEQLPEWAEKNLAKAIEDKNEFKKEWDEKNTRTEIPLDENINFLEKLLKYFRS